MSVYYITAREVGLVKIGCAWDAARRLAALQSCCPVELVLEASFKGSYREERELHARHAEHRVRGEWFTLTPQLEAEIKTTGLEVRRAASGSLAKRYAAAMAEMAELKREAA